MKTVIRPGPLTGRRIMERRGDKAERVMELAHRRGFFWPSTELYGGVGGFLDFGPLGAAMKRKLEEKWRRWFVLRHQDFIVEVETPVVMLGKVFEASGHVKHFTDYVVSCVSCGRKYRADHLIEEATGLTGLEGFSAEELSRLIEERGVKCPECGGRLEEVRPFNLLFRTPGVHTIEAVADTLAWIVETNETNNADLAQITVQKPADLAVVSVFGPAELVAGETYTFNVTVKNHGEAPAEEFRVLVRYLEAEVESSPLTLGPGEELTVQFNLSFPESGTYVVEVILDPEDVVPEYNEENNYLNFSVVVGAPPMPDIMILTTGYEAVIEPVEYGYVTRLTVNMTVTNVGAEVTTPFRCVIIIDEVYVVDITIPGLEPGETRVLTGYIELEGNYLGHEIIYVVDYDNSVVEANEENNYATMTIGEE